MYITLLINSIGQTIICTIITKTRLKIQDPVVN